MKYWIGLLSIVCLVNCDRKADQEQNPFINLVGTWQLTGFRIRDGYMAITDGTTISPASFNSGGKAFNSKVVFQSDGSYVSDGTCTIVDSIYHNSKTPFIQQSALDSFLRAGTWEHYKDTLKLNTDKGLSFATIMDSSAVKLLLKIDFDTQIQTTANTILIRKGSAFYTLER